VGEQRGLDAHAGRDRATQIRRDAERAQHSGARDYINHHADGQNDSDDQRLAGRESEGLRALLDLWQTSELAGCVEGQKSSDEDTDRDSGLADP
jgi:hypothetical protein